MSSLEWKLLIVLVTVMAFQGASCIVIGEKDSLFGVLDLALAAVIPFGIAALSAGWIILAPEFGVVMCQGYGTLWLLRFSLVLAAIVPAACWCKTRRLKGRGPYQWLLLPIGAIVGISAAASIFTVNPNDSGILLVHAFDLWWPPLAVWVMVCAFESILVLFGWSMRPLRVALVGLMLALAGVFALNFEDLTGPWSQTLWAIVVAAAALAAIMSVGTRVESQGERISERARARWTTIKIYFSTGSHQAPAISAGLVLAIEILALGAISFDLFFFGFFGRSLGIFVILLLWIVLTEQLALATMPTIGELWNVSIPLQAAARKVASGLKTVRGRLAKLPAAVKAVFGEGSAAGIAGGSVLLAVGSLLSLVVIIVANEVLNYRQIVIHTVQGAGQDSAVCDRISADVVNALGQLQSDLQSLDIKGASSDRRHLNSTIDTNSNGLSGAISGDSLKVGSVSVPMKYLVAPIQSFVRSFLGIRVIEINAEKVSSTPKDTYKVLADSNDGNSWSVPERAKNKPPPLPCDNAKPDVDGNDPEKIADQLAFDVASSDPWFAVRGLTRNWPAFVYFRSGLDFTHSYARENNHKDLAGAINCFEDAVSNDATFAPGFYWLGVALRYDHRPAAAIDAFQKALAADPDFVAAASNKGWTLYDFDNYQLLPAAVMQPVPGTNARQENRRNLARTNWIEAFERGYDSWPTAEKRSVFLGLCTSELDKESTLAGETGEKLYYVPYFYCAGAQALTEQLPVWARQDANERQLEASILNRLGYIVENRLGKFTTASFPDQWTCTADGINPADIQSDGSLSRVYLWGGLRSSRALALFRRSQELAPEDLTIRCNVARVAGYTSGSPTEMESLAADSDAHIVLADSLANRADANLADHPELAPRYYQAALRESRKAIDLNPDSLFARNQFAYTLWEWKLNRLRGRVQEGPSRGLAYSAEVYAREVIRGADRLKDDEWENVGKDTLGEVLIALGRTEEATTVLSPLVTKQDENGQGEPETRWDLAKAEICDASVHEDPGGTRRLHAAATFASLSDDGQVRQGQSAPFNRDDLDVAEQAGQCADAPSREPLTGPFAAAMRPRKLTNGGHECVWSVVGDTNAARQQYRVHVWGEGVDDRIPIGEGSSRSVLLTAPQEGVRSEFFAQLESANGSYASPVDSFEIAESPKSNDCSSSQIKLIFDVSARAPQAATP